MKNIEILKRMLAVATVALLCACANLPGFGPTVTRSGFDDARSVDIDDRASICTAVQCLRVGAQWTSRIPERAVLTFYPRTSGRSITRASIGIDGKTARLAPAFEAVGGSGSRVEFRESPQSFVVPVALLREIVASRDARIRLVTADGQVDEALTDGGPSGSKLLSTLRGFLAEIDRG